jgi:hypothetical protein
MVGLIVRRTLPMDDANRFSQQVMELHRAVAGDGGEPLEAARAVHDALDDLVKRLASRSFNHEDVRAMLRDLVDDAQHGAYRDYAGAEQATMAMAGLLGFLARHGALRDVRGANAALDRVYDSVKNDEAFRPEAFRVALANLGQQVTR